MNQDAVAAGVVARHETRSHLTPGLMSEAVPTFTLHQDGRVDHHSGRRWCHHCRGVGGHYTQDHPSAPVLGTLSRGPALVLEQPIALRPQDVPPGIWRDIVEAGRA